MYEWVVIKSSKALDSFLALAESKGGELRGVKTMRIDSEIVKDAISSATIGKVLGCVRRDLERLTLSHCTVDPSDLVQLEQLVRLSIMSGTVIRSPELNISLPRLRYLQIQQVTFASPIQFFSPAFLPALYSLSLRHIAHRELHADSLRPLLPQLKALDITPAVEWNSDTTPLLISLDSIKPPQHTAIPFPPPPPTTTTICLPTRFLYVSVSDGSDLHRAVTRNIWANHDVIYVDDTRVFGDRDGRVAEGVQTLRDQGRSRGERSLS